VIRVWLPETLEEIRFATLYVASKVDDFNPESTHSIICSVNSKSILGAVAYHNFRTTDIEMVAAGEGRWLNRNALRAYFAHPFLKLNCMRVTAICHKGNKRARKFVLKAGFKQEGVHPSAMPDGKTAISYGMERKNCRWII